MFVVFEWKSLELEVFFFSPPLMLVPVPLEPRTLLRDLC